MGDFLFENYIVVPSNKQAYDACLEFVDISNKEIAPVLLIYGPVGCGKTHLLNAIGNSLLQQRPTRKAITVTIENYTNEFVEAIRSHSISNFREKYRSLGILLIDDFQFISGKGGTQEEFFHNFNALVNSGGKIALTCLSAPGKLPALEDLMLSRTLMGVVQEIFKPSDEEVQQIIERKYSDSTVSIPQKQLEYLAQSAGGDVRRAIGIADRIYHYSGQRGSMPDITEMREWLSQPPLVFLSYSWADKETVLAVDQWLRDAGVRVLLDERNFWAGEDIQDQIIHCIKQAGTVICFYSKNSVDRPYPKLERRIAEELQLLSGSNGYNETRVIYFCLDETELPLQQKFRLAIMARGLGFEEACKELIRGITRTIDTPKRIDLSKYKDKPPW